MIGRTARFSRPADRVGRSPFARRRQGRTARFGSGRVALALSSSDVETHHAGSEHRRETTDVIKIELGVRGLLAASRARLVAGCGGGGGRPRTRRAWPVTDAGPVAAERVGQGPRLMFITNSNSDWWNAVEKGMKDGGEKFGAEVELRRNEGQPEGQIQLLEDALSLPDVKGVAVSVLEAESPGIADKMRELQKAGKVVITIDSDGQSDARRAYIGTNNHKAGEVAGKAAATLRPAGRQDGRLRRHRRRRQRQRAPRGVLRRGRASVRARSRSSRTAATQRPRPVERPDRDHQVPRPRRLPRPLVVQRPADRRGGRQVARAPQEGRPSSPSTSTSWPSSTSRRGGSTSRVCQNPYEMGYQGVRLLKALVENDKATVDEMLPDGHDGHRHRRPRDRPHRRTRRSRGTTCIDIKAMKEWLTSKGLKSS